MASRKAKRNEWHLTKRGWTRSIGERGVRIRLFQKRKGENFYRAVWRPGHGVDKKCLYTTNRDEAERLARGLLARAILHEEPETRVVVTLRYLLDRYTQESAMFLDNGETAKREARTRAKILCAYFGADYDVREFRADDLTTYAQGRLAGGIVYGVDPKTGKEYKTRRVRMRSVECDLMVLYTALRWGTTVRVGKGRLLDFHPLQGIPRPREKNPKRPIATWERHQKMRATAQGLAAQAQAASADTTKTVAARAEGDFAYSKWTQVELALVLLEATGRRRGAIRQLRWEDMTLPAGETGEIKWRAEADKKRQEWATPIPAELVGELRTFRQKLGAARGLVFPSPHDPTQPIRGDVLSRWIQALERSAGVPKLDGGLCHPYRRKWATERKHLPLNDVAEAGGWKNTDTLTTCYQQIDRQTLLAVMSEPRKVTEIGLAGAS